MISVLATILMTRGNLGPKLAKATAWGIVLLVAALVLFGAYRLVTGGDRAKARLGENQTEAAIESGKDAVQTVGAAGERDASIDRTTTENNDAIQKADGADAPVASGVRDAGLASLCRRASYRNDPRCLQRATAR